MLDSAGTWRRGSQLSELSESHYRTIGKGHYRTIGAIGVLSEFTIGLSDQGSGRQVASSYWCMHIRETQNAQQQLHELHRIILVCVNLDDIVDDVVNVRLLCH